MSNNLPTDHHGFDLLTMSQEIDHLFGFESTWEATTDSGKGTWEHEGHIVINLDQMDRLCTAVDSLGPDNGHIFRYVLVHQKAHHDQDLHRSYSKSYVEDVRPYELDADLVAGWVCANARIPNSFRFHGLALNFNDLGRRGLLEGKSEADVAGSVPEYPWPAERELALIRGGRTWAAGQLSAYNGAAQRLGIPDESFQEFLAEVPFIVNSMWSRPIPKT